MLSNIQLFYTICGFCHCVHYSTEKTVLVSTGFHGDVLTLTKLIEARLKVISTLIYVVLFLHSSMLLFVILFSL